MELDAVHRVDETGGMPGSRLYLQPGLAKSPCRGFATRNLAGVGLADAGSFINDNHPYR